KEAGLDPDLIQRKPALALAKMAVAGNPDVEMVSVDEAHDQITVRDKKSGKTMVVNVRQAADGKISFTGEDGQEVTLEAKGNGAGNGIVSVKTKEGTAQFGSGTSATLPSWLPSYPGASVQGNFSTKTSDGEGGSVSFATSDTPEQVAKFYEAALREAGLKPNTNSITANGIVSLTTVSAESESRTVSVTAIPGDNHVTAGTGVYKSK